MKAQVDAVQIQTPLIGSQNGVEQFAGTTDVYSSVILKQSETKQAIAYDGIEFAVRWKYPELGWGRRALDKQRDSHTTRK